MIPVKRFSYKIGFSQCLFKSKALDCVTLQIKAIEQYFHVVLFILLYKVVLTFRSVNGTLVYDHSNESY